MQTKKIKLNDGFYATVDDEDYDRLMDFAENVGVPWVVTKSSTNKVTVQANWNSMCRIVLKAKKGIVVTHINGDGLDNRKQNLRLCSMSQAKSMQKGKMSNNRSGYRGVSDSGPAYKKKWRAELNYNGKRYRLGNFYDKEEAARAYDKKAYELMGEAAYLNFPNEKE
jgi:hypothetical protein